MNASERSSISFLRSRMVSVTTSSAASTSASSRCTSALGITPTVRPLHERAARADRAHRRDVAAAGDQRPPALGDRHPDLTGQCQQLGVGGARSAIDTHRKLAVSFTGHVHNGKGCW